MSTLSQPPKDPVMLLSFVNTQLRDYYDSFNEMADALAIDRRHTTEQLRSIGYEYDPATNQFV